MKSTNIKFVVYLFLFLFTFASLSGWHGQIHQTDRRTRQSFGRACLSVSTAYAQSWDELTGSATGGGLSNNTGHFERPSLALDSSGNPHIAWEDYPRGNPEIYYRYWNPFSGTTSPKICRIYLPTFNVKQGKTKCKILKIWNCGKGTLNWTVSEDCDWLTLTPSSGTSTWEKDTVKACVNTAGLEKGAYPCTVTVTGEGASNSP